jgi:hypothetical protein
VKKLYFIFLILLFLLPGHLLAACISAIAVNSSESETWDSSCLSENYAGRYAKYFTFTLSSAAQVTIDLTSTKDTYLFLLEGTGKTGSVIDFNDDIDGVNNKNSRIVQTLQAGNYTVEATTYAGATTGTFTVSVSAATPSVDACDNYIETNTEVSASWVSAPACHPPIALTRTPSTSRLCCRSATR